MIVDCGGRVETNIDLSIEGIKKYLDIVMEICPDFGIEPSFDQQTIKGIGKLLESILCA